MNNQKILEYIRKGVLGVLILWVLIMLGGGFMKYRSAKNEAPKQAEQMLEERMAAIDQARAEETEIFGGPLTPRMSQQEQYEFVRDNTADIFEKTFYPDYTAWMIANTKIMLIIALVTFVLGMLIASLVFNLKGSLLYIGMFVGVAIIFLISFNVDLSGAIDGLRGYYTEMTPEELESMKLGEDNLDFWLSWVNGGVVTVYILAGIAVLIALVDGIRGMFQGK
jgi:hypothetical protein